MATASTIVLLGPITPYRGGISAFNTSLAAALSQAGHRVCPIAWQNGSAGVRRTLQIDASMPVQRDCRYLLNWYNPLSWIRAARYAASLHPDLLIAHWTLPEIAPVYALITALIKRRSPATEIVYIVHNAIPHTPGLATPLLRQLGFSHVDRFIVHAESEKHRLQAKLRGRPLLSAFHPLYDRYLNRAAPGPRDAPAPPWCEWLGQRKGQPVILFFGYIKPYKGLDVLLQAMPRTGNAVLIVAGQVSRSCQNLRALSQTPELRRRVLWIDRYIADDEVSAIFSCAQVVALPYHSATQSGIAGLALAFELPVVATRTGGLSESIVQGKTGYLVPVNDPDALAEALNRAIGERVRLQQEIRAMKKLRSWSRYCEILLSRPETGTR